MNIVACCARCSQNKSCGKYHIYVIELDYVLVQNRRFMSANPQYKQGFDCLYVGSTSHTCQCRFQQHILHAKKRELGYYRTCRGYEEFREFYRGGGHTRGSYYPGVYGLRLRPDLFASRNPVADKKRAFMEEEKLAAALRTKGYAVWQH